MIERHTTLRTSCRVCSGRLIPLFSLGSQYVSNFISDPNDCGVKVPINLVMCDYCSLVQLEHTAPQDFLYTRHYWYRSGVTETMRAALRDITKKIESLVRLDPGDVVLDIGSNDGTLLRSYEALGIVTVGVEPAINLKEDGSKGVDVFINEFWGNSAVYHDKIKKRAKVITAIGMFYDLENPNSFIRDVANALDQDNGVFVAQLMCLQNMIDMMDVGNLAHEHLEFYSLKSLTELYGRHGLEIFNIETNNVNGKSYRIHARHEKSRVVQPLGSHHRINQAWLRERKLEDEVTYHTMFEKMEANKKKAVNFIKKQVNEGKTCWVYGASTKGNVILQYYGLDQSLIAGASDRSPEKWGKFMVGSGIPIYSEEDARKANPDYFLVLPYAFLDEFLIREKAWREQGGKFIVPLPEFRVV